MKKFFSPVTIIYRKFGQRVKLGKVKFCFEDHEFWQLLTSDQFCVNDVIFHGDLCAQVEYSEAEEFVTPGLNTNVVIAAFTTAFARLILWKSLNALGENVLYYDTGLQIHDFCKLNLLFNYVSDSIIYVYKEDNGGYEPPYGDVLGAFKDEVGNGDHILEFVSAGPKNYGYKTAHGNKILKVRGFTLKPKAAEQLNFDVVSELVQARAFRQRINVDMGTTIARDPKTWTLKTRQNQKQYRLLYDKRVLLDYEYKTVPFGFLFPEDIL